VILPGFLHNGVPLSDVITDAIAVKEAMLGSPSGGAAHPLCRRAGKLLPAQLVTVWGDINSAVALY
jgi:hypothetical protein